MDKIIIGKGGTKMSKTYKSILSYSSEVQFANHLKFVAQIHNCHYTQIPDVVKALYGRVGRKNVIAAKRPCDGVFSTPQGLIFVELKKDYNSLEDHQRRFLTEEFERNGLAVVIRAINRKRKRGQPYIIYRIEAPTGEIICEVDDIDDLVIWLKAGVNNLREKIKGGKNGKQ